MKQKWILLVVLMIGITSAIGQVAVNQSSGAAFRWSEESYDFSTIQQGTSVTHTFTFTNTGAEPLAIISAKASCGCTVADYSHDPVPPGQEGYVKVTFNPSSIGPFHKTVSIISNANDEAVLLKIQGTVVEKVSR